MSKQTKELEKEIETLKKELKQSKQEYIDLATAKDKVISELRNSKEDDFSLSVGYQQMQKELQFRADTIDLLKSHMKMSDDTINELKQDKDHLIFELSSANEKISELEQDLKIASEKNVRVKNERHAGRKPNDKKMMGMIESFSKLIEEGKNQDEIMSALDISRATYFRYKNRIK